MKIRINYINELYDLGYEFAYEIAMDCYKEYCKKYEAIAIPNPTINNFNWASTANPDLWGDLSSGRLTEEDLKLRYSSIIFKNTSRLETDDYLVQTNGLFKK